MYVVLADIITILFISFFHSFIYLFFVILNLFKYYYSFITSHQKNPLFLSYYFLIQQFLFIIPTKDKKTEMKSLRYKQWCLHFTPFPAFSCEQQHQHHYHTISIIIIFIFLGFFPLTSIYYIFTFVRSSVVIKQNEFNNDMQMSVSSFVRTEDLHLKHYYNNNKNKREWKK